MPEGKKGGWGEPCWRRQWQEGIKKKLLGVGATIRIGQEILCLPYAGFLYSRVLVNSSKEMKNSERSILELNHSNMAVGACCY